MRLLLRLAIPIGVLIAAAVGFVPLLGARTALSQDAANAAAAALHANGSPEQAARLSAQSHPGVQMTSFKLEAPTAGVPTATVVLEEKVDTFLSDWPGIKGAFRIHATGTASGSG